MKTFINNLFKQYNNGLYTLTNHKSNNPEEQVLKKMYEAAINGDYNIAINSAQSLLEFFNFDKYKFFSFIIDNKDKYIKHRMLFY